MVRVLPDTFDPPPLELDFPQADTPTANAATIKTAAIRVARKVFPLLLKGTSEGAIGLAPFVGRKSSPLPGRTSRPASRRSAKRGGRRLRTDVGQRPAGALVAAESPRRHVAVREHPVVAQR